MAIYHCTCQVVSRGQGRSAVGAAAYRSGDTLTNEYDGITHDYSNKGGVVYSEIMLCENAPERYLDRGTLWNEVERVEKSAKAQLCREYEMALPRELTREEQIKYVREFIHEEFVKKGMCADFSIHDKGDGNPHVHILVTMRPIEKDGTWGTKQKKEYILDKDGNKQYDKKKQTYKCKTIKTTNWDSKEFLQGIREAWAKAINRELERKNLPDRVDHRTLEAQGIDRLPTLHEGVAQREMKTKIAEGKMEPIEWEYDKGKINEDIKQANVQTAAIDKEMSEVERSVGSIKEDIAWSGVHRELYRIEEARFADSWSEAAQLESLQRLDKLAALTAEISEAQKGSAYHAGATIEDKPYLDYHREKAANDQDFVRVKIGQSLDFIRTAYPHHESYNYGKITPLDIDTRMRTDRGEDGFLKVAKRSGTERAIIMDAQKAHKELSTVYDTTQLQRLIAQQAEAQRLRKPTRSRDEELVRQIQESFANLKFVEQKGIYSTEQARATMVELQGKLDSCTAEIRNAEIMLAHLGREDAAKAAEYHERVAALKAQLPALSQELEGYTRCVKIFDRIDNEMGRPRPALTGPVQEQTRKPERAADLPKAEPQAVPERKQPLDSKIADAAKKGEQQKQTQQAAKETSRVDLPKAEPKAVPFDAYKTAMQLIQHRADFIRESIKAEQPSYYTPNVAYRHQAQYITDCVSKIRDYKDTLDKLAEERNGLGLFQGKKKKELEAKFKDFADRRDNEIKKLEPIAKEMGFNVHSLTAAEAAAKSLRELAAQEDAKAKAALANVGAAERANVAKLEYIAIAKTVPEDKRRAVLAEVERYKPTEIVGLTNADFFRGEKLAVAQLDAVLKPEKQQEIPATKEQSQGKPEQVAAKEEQPQRTEPSEQKKGSLQKTMDEVKAEIAAERAKQAAMAAGQPQKTQTKTKSGRGGRGD